MSTHDAAIPAIDLAAFRAGGRADKAAVARAVAAACEGSGFFCVTGHGVDEALVARTRQAAVDFFARPEAEKRVVSRPPEKISRGYFPFRDRSLAYSLGVAAPPDLQEAWAMGPDAPAEAGADDPYYRTEVAGRFFAPNHWPAAPAGFRPTLTAYYDALAEVAAVVMRACALALDLPEDFFADKTDRHCSVVRLIRYPAPSGAPEPGQLRAGAHTDYGTVTILRGDDVPGALQVASPSGAWLDVKPPAGGFVCNIGDAMAYWTGGRWRSTLHRVANPPGNPPDEAGAGDRISLVFFHLPNHDAVLGGIAGDGDGVAPTVAEHYLGKVMKAAHGRLDAGVDDAMGAGG